MGVLCLLLALAPPPDGHFIVDATASLHATTLADVDELASTIHVGGFGELMVLVVDSTGKSTAQKFGVDTFSNWPVGHAENVDGALLVIALKDKKAAVVLGDGYGRIAQSELDALIASAVTPALRDGRNDDAVRDGAKAVLRLLESHHPPPVVEAETPAVKGPQQLDAQSDSSLPTPTDAPPPTLWLLLFQVVMPIVSTVCVVVFLVLFLRRKF